MTVHLAKFISNLSQETSVLRKLLSNNVEWIWTENEKRCSDPHKQLVTSTSVLSYFDLLKETVLSVNASSFGLGAVVAQGNHPIEYASISLTQTQQKFNHIGKELLAFVPEKDIDDVVG
ncbi:hypothetical protein JTB14_016186 [Gonioctena quinquepunctata]|nr:hypothetical protein JTB14_016186 [Gonioctena quinquepunctata]